MVKERMEVRRQGDELYFKNHAVDDEGVVAKLVDGAARISYVNFHGDATQAFHRCQIGNRPCSFWRNPPRTRAQRTSSGSTPMARWG